MSINKLIIKIKRGETPFYARIRMLLKSLYKINPPYLKSVHLPLYFCQYATRSAIKWMVHFLWSIPVFKARCDQVGRNLSLPNGIPYVTGSHLRIYLGNDVTIFKTTIGASKVIDDPVLKLGNGTSIGFGTILSVSKEVDIGNNCMIGPMCLIMDNDDHPIDPERRLRGEGVREEEINPIRIGDNVWIGAYAAILKGVTIGDNSIIAAHTVVTKDVMENCVYAGFPARPTLREINKSGKNQKEELNQFEGTGDREKCLE